MNTPKKSQLNKQEITLELLYDTSIDKRAIGKAMLQIKGLLDSNRGELQESYNAMEGRMFRISDYHAMKMEQNMKYLLQECLEIMGMMYSPECEQKEIETYVRRLHEGFHTDARTEQYFQFILNNSHIEQDHVAYIVALLEVFFPFRGYGNADITLPITRKVGEEINGMFE